MKQAYKLLAVCLTLLLLAAMAAGCVSGNVSSKLPQKVEAQKPEMPSSSAPPTETPTEPEAPSAPAAAEAPEDAPAEEPAAPEAPAEAPAPAGPEQTPALSVSDQTTFYVGDTIHVEGLELVYVACGEYVSDNMFIQPDEGKKYIYLELFCKNISNSDKSISAFEFNCYADGYAADDLWAGDDTLSARLSSGRTTSGKLYFEVPENAEQIEIEYEYDLFSDKKLILIYEGEKQSGFVPEPDTTASQDAIAPGDVVETRDLRISYLACEEYASDNLFLQPADGCRFISCKFEFENLSDSDQVVSSLDFNCYADGRVCEQSFMPDDDLSTATLSSGRKVLGTVTFEVPDTAAVVELEFDVSYWTSEHLVFTVR